MHVKGYKLEFFYSFELISGELVKLFCNEVIKTRIVTNEEEYEKLQI